MSRYSVQNIIAEPYKQSISIDISFVIGIDFGFVIWEWFLSRK